MAIDTLEIGDSFDLPGYSRRFTVEGLHMGIDDDRVISCIAEDGQQRIYHIELGEQMVKTIGVKVERPKPCPTGHGRTDIIGKAGGQQVIHCRDCDRIAGINWQ